MQSQRTEETQGSYRLQAEQGLLEFIEQAWPVVEPATPFVSGDHIKGIAAHLEAVTRGEIRALLINLPPRHMKSLTVSVFWPVWEWIATPSRRWLFASYAASLSTRDSLRCRRLIESDWFQARWGDRFMLTTDQNEKMRFENDHTGCRLAIGVGGAATGEGGDRVVVDDPHNVAERESEAIRRATLTWWDETMSTRLNDPKTGARVIVMQRIHEKDLSGHVLEQGGYVHLCMPAEFEPAHRCVTSLPWKDERAIEGQLLWPERISQREIADFKLRLGPSGYAGQFQQRPAPAGGNRFSQDWFRYYQPTGSGYVLAQPDGTSKTVARQDCSRFAVMDPAGTEPDQNTRPCYTVIQVWDVTPAHDMILVHQYRQQVQAPDAAAAAERIAREFDVQFIAIEKDGLGLGIVQTVRRTGITVKPIKARGSKEARSETAEIRMAAGMIYFPHGAPFLWDLEQELIHFPHSEYCDQVDALAHAALLVQRTSGSLGMGQVEEPEAEPFDNSSLDPFDDEWV
jgi:predicted phage terminase large subunit-like protein